MSYFTFRKLTPEDSLFPELFKLRYRVYIEEWKFEKPEDHPGGIERNIYDDHAVHLAAILNKEPSVIGTSRLVLDSPHGFPIEENMEITADTSNIPRNKICEISRLCVRGDYSRRRDDKALNGDDSTGSAKEDPKLVNQRREENDIVTGIFKCIAKESRIHGITHWYVGMARGLNVLLKRRGINFEEAGPEIDYHGLRRPYFGPIEKILAKSKLFLDIYTGKTDFPYDENSL
ncbi:N-acyl amino acid synthase, PEP-CTERM/exosortase system-associated [Malonomonas rubra DSM 5091]|uniref:N-acyl amino acid synthase, PEP-CTERM/exosortase system-associated n=1 Tax=Malonomonas rubra DSM 5091 TaxID=1122189 RepID=A0A1M6KFR3_MALRU|nr:PEP-CTERM/exosortase system-associated acyltransferase [Malonomonas rubra]SHJ57779.1 N-acyl amino acid synthase, PEP-CTERM/exosortase system-associated [Malonomonas rubra DSM 5091]